MDSGQKKTTAEQEIPFIRDDYPTGLRPGLTGSGNNKKQWKTRKNKNHKYLINQFTKYLWFLFNGFSIAFLEPGTQSRKYPGASRLSILIFQYFIIVVKG
jgi:hypothetical protein